MFHRYLELMYPIWHKTHFKVQWIYIGFATNVLFWIGFALAVHIPTAKVTQLLHSNLG